MRNLINGKNLDSSDGDAIEIRNPSNNHLIATVPDSTEEDVDYCVKCAKEAQKAWSETPLYKRIEILKKLASLIERDTDTLSETLCKETGITINEAKIEVKESTNIINFCINKAQNFNLSSENNQEHIIQLSNREPIGVVACILPFNSSCIMFSKIVTSGLLIGNSVVVKPSKYNSLTIHKYCLLLQEAGIPDGVINCISGEDLIISQSLAKNKNINLVYIDESPKIKTEVLQSVAKNHTHVITEKVGSNAMIVDSDADIDLAIDKAIKSCLYNAGQSNNAIKRILVNESVDREFLLKLNKKIIDIKVGNPLDEKIKMGCLINEGAATKVQDQIAKSISQGAKIYFGGRKNGAYFEPTILFGIKKEMDIMKNMNISGPVIPVYIFNKIDEAIEIVNQSSSNMIINIFSANVVNALNMSKKIKAEKIIINESSSTSPEDQLLGSSKDYDSNIEYLFREMSVEKKIVLCNIF